MIMENIPDQNKLASRIHLLSEKFLPEITEIRRHIHANPELSFHESETSAYICSKLKSRGIEYKITGETGITAVIKGLPDQIKTIALRADMDALPIDETNDLPFRSIKPGIMHACGHDLHVASLLGTVFILNELKNDFAGNIKFIFQPGEEVLPGGAKSMIENGVLKNPDVNLIIGQHVFPELDAGKAGFRQGLYMSSADEIHITVKGKGGHAAMPWKLVDPVLITSHLIVALQQIVSRNVITTIPSVLSFGKIDAAGTTNVIPDEVTIAGTFRTFDEKWRAEVHKKINQITEGLVSSMGGTADIEIRKGYPVLVNHDDLTRRCREYATDFLGKENVAELEIRMTSDDFSYFTHEIPGCYYRLGVNSPGNKVIPVLHNSNFIADESALKTGMGLMSYICIRELDL